MAEELKARGAEEVAILSAVTVVFSSELKAISWPDTAEACGQLGLDLRGVQRLALVGPWVVSWGSCPSFFLQRRLIKVRKGPDVSWPRALVGGIIS